MATGFAIISKYLRRRREGFYVNTSGNADGGDLTYHEAEGTLTFYFDRSERTVHVPSARSWLEQMPDWAKARRSEIIGNIQKRLGMSWKFQEKAD